MPCGQNYLLDSGSARDAAALRKTNLQNFTIQIEN